jgi:hypothetical protein
LAGDILSPSIVVFSHGDFAYGAVRVFRPAPQAYGPHLVDWSDKRFFFHGYGPCFVDGMQLDAAV